jgi:hypothetical protein
MRVLPRILTFAATTFVGYRVTEVSITSSAIADDESGTLYKNNEINKRDRRELIIYYSLFLYKLIHDKRI